jgi:NAD(P)-dependent dehydrogenase (short-subunit alcohol dehydrogenase family)
LRSAGAVEKVPAMSATQKLCVVTGATSGIGLATAHQLAALGAKVVVVGRNPATAGAAVEQLRRDTGSRDLEWLAADFADLAQVRELATEFHRRHQRLDVLVNNAGATFRERRLTGEGVEMTFAVNHLAPFTLTNLLLPALRTGAPSRIVNVASVAHERGRLDLDDLTSNDGYRPFQAYARSKLCTLLFTYELARRLDDTGVTVNAADPGLVRTPFGSRNGRLRTLAWYLIHLRYRSTSVSPSAGADTIVHLATAPEVAATTGRYFAKRRPVPSSAASQDVELAGRLWQVSEELAGLRPVTQPTS